MTATQKAAARSVLGGRGTVRRNVLANAVGGVFTMLGQLAAVPLGLAAVGVPAYGAWSIVVAVVQYAALFDFGIPSATLLHVARRHAARAPSRGTVFRAALAAMTATGLLVGSATGAIVAVLLPGLLLPLGASGPTSALLPAACGVTVFLALLGRHFQSVNQGSQRYDVERTHQVLSMILRLAGLVAIWRLQGGIAGLACVELFAVVGPGLFSLVRVRRSAPSYTLLGPGRDLITARALLAFGLPWFWTTATIQAVAVLPAAIVGLTLGPRASAAMAAATRITLGARQVLGWIFEPIGAAASADRANAFSRIVPVTRLLLAASAALVVPSVVLAPAFMAWWIRDGGTAGDAALFFIASGIAILVTVPHGPFAVLQAARGIPSYYLVETVVWGAATLGGLCLLAPLGVWGVVTAIVVPAALVEVSYVRRMLLVTHGGAVLARLLGQFAVLIAPGTVLAVLVEVALGSTHLPASTTLALAGATYVAVTGAMALGLRRSALLGGR